MSVSPKPKGAKQSASPKPQTKTSKDEVKGSKRETKTEVKKGKSKSAAKEMEKAVEEAKITKKGKKSEVIPPKSGKSESKVFFEFNLSLEASDAKAATGKKAVDTYNGPPPPRARNAYSFFSQQNLKRIVDEKQIKVTEAMKVVASMWNTLSEE